MRVTISLAVLKCRDGCMAQLDGPDVNTGLVYHPVRADRSSDWSTAATT